VSVGVEAQEWAANFFATGGNPSTNLHSDVELTKEEATALRDQWIETPPNMPQVTSGGLQLREVPHNSQSAQMMQAREYQNGDFARMFNIPGSLLDHAIPGTSLTYQNVGNEFDKFVRTCLLPNYLEPMEQALTDLLTRSTTTRFNTEALLRADARTRWEIYERAVTVLGPEEAASYARSREGLAGGDIETAPVPLAPPQAIPSSLPVQTRSLSDHLGLTDLRCPKCGKLAGRVAGPAEIACARCGQLVAA
jgi:phage portal protein BeeE